MQPILQTRKLTFTYEGQPTPALDGVTVDIYPGQKVALLGQNGAGKSTFFLQLNGVLKPDRGQLLLDGQLVTYGQKSLSNLRQQVGVVFQDPDDMLIAPTVLGEVSFGPMNLKLPKEEVSRRAHQALSFMQLEHYASRCPHYLSGGEKKRVSVADVLAMDARVLLLDEPTASLDPQNTVLLRTALDALHAAGKTLLLSTHDIDFAYQWADRVLVFSSGRLIADAPPRAVFGDSELLRLSGLVPPIWYAAAHTLQKAGLLPPGCWPTSPTELQASLLVPHPPTV